VWGRTELDGWMGCFLALGGMRQGGTWGGREGDKFYETHILDFFCLYNESGGLGVNKYLIS